MSGEDLQVVCQGRLDAVKIHYLVSRPRKAPLGTRAVIAYDEEDEGIVGVREFLDGVEQTTALVIRKCEITCEVFHKRRKQRSFIAGQRIPRLDPIRTRRQNRIRRDDSQFELPLIGLFAHRRPSQHRTCP